MKPLIQHLEPDQMAVILGTGYQRFTAMDGNVVGLAKVVPDSRLDVLAVVAAPPGKGHFRDFIRVAKEQFHTICVWYDDNPQVGPALERYGFTPETEIQGDGEIAQGWRWDKPK